MLEIEKTYLIKELPENVEKFPYTDLLDLYIPDTADHPKLRLRKRGEKKEMTKKTLVSEGDASCQIEQTIALSDEEYNHLAKLNAKKVHKLRYEMPYNGYTLEIDVFKDNLEGLILCDIEFPSETEKDAFIPPLFCIADMTQENWLAGGMLCGKKYKEIEENIKKI